MVNVSLADGATLLFVEDFRKPAEAEALFRQLRDRTDWKQEVGHGRPFPRLTAWYADKGLAYSYSGVTHLGNGWSPELLAVKQDIERASQAEFNSLLINLYRDGKDSIGFHADDEPELGTNPVVASLSLGSARDFVLKHKKTGEKHTYELGHGCLLVMAGTCQQVYLHGVPKTKSEVGERINLTFRRILPLTATGLSSD